MKEELLDLKKAIDEGREGKSVWIPLQFPRMGQHIGVGRGIYTIIGGQSGTGKTAFTDLAYVLYPYNWMKKNRDQTDIEIKIIYRSMERSKRYKLAKWVSMRLFIKYGILMSVPEILTRGVKESKVTNEIYQKIVESFNYFEEMLDHVEIIDGPMNPTGIYEHVKEYANTIGRIEEIPYVTKEGIERKRKVYKQNNDKLITIIIEDHLGRTKGELSNGRFLQPHSKELLDKMSEYNSSTFRDFYGFSPVAVSQFNRGIEETMRRVKTDLSPLPSDFKGSGNMYEDADVALALYNPFKLGYTQNLGYPVNRFVNEEGYNRFRSCYILKNSYGIDDAAIGYNFIGEVGLMRELPKPNEITDYSAYV